MKTKIYKKLLAGCLSAALIAGLTLAPAAPVSLAAETDETTADAAFAEDAFRRKRAAIHNDEALTIAIEIVESQVMRTCHRTSVMDIERRVLPRRIRPVAQ